ncbi:hypothetical protein Y1Q_0023171 [Alligator mississippiensis]|uniref:Uncharacterized protein n=1 Tax=Alligator mississippiensis TaxID=8496 RepID=A0A151MZB6_ALLMI|nr:hypothetical protein Y1Q_0023171 [Alligator mississippiensis]
MYALRFCIYGDMNIYKAITKGLAKWQMSCHGMQTQKKGFEIYRQGGNKTVEGNWDSETCMDSVEDVSDGQDQFSISKSLN